MNTSTFQPDPQILTTNNVLAVNGTLVSQLGSQFANRVMNAQFTGAERAGRGY